MKNDLTEILGDDEVFKGYLQKGLQAVKDDGVKYCAHCAAELDLREGNCLKCGYDWSTPYHDAWMAQRNRK